MEGREMAYNPTTWGSNDVITKDRLNKMEQGIVSASKLSGTDIDTDKDWNGKSITNVGAISVDDTADPNPNGLLRAYPSDIAITTSATERSYAGAGSEVVKKISVSVSGMYRVTCELKVNNGYRYGTAQILKNGVVVASFGGIGQAYAPWSADLIALAGEEFQIRLTSPDPAWRVYVRNFAIRGSCAVVPKATRTEPAGTVVLD